MENAPEVHVTVVEDATQREEPADTASQVAETIGAAAAVVEMAQQLADVGAERDDGESVRLLREIAGKLDAVIVELAQIRESSATAVSAALVDVLQDAEAEAEAEEIAADVVEEIETVVKETVEEVAPEVTEEKPRERRRRWI